MRTRRPGIRDSWQEALRWLGKILLAGTVSWAIAFAVIFGAYAATCAPAEAQDTDSADILPQSEWGAPLYSTEYVVYDSSRVHDGISETMLKRCSAPDAPPDACTWTRQIARSYRAGAEDVRSHIRGVSLHLDSLARENGWKRVRCDRGYPKHGDAAMACLILRAYLHGRHVGAEHGEP